MSPILAAALVAGAVSLTGVLVSVYLARRAHEAAQNQTRLSAKLNLDHAAVVALKAYAREVEKARVVTWRIRSEAGVILERPVYLNSVNPLREIHTQVKEQYERMFESWADVKLDVPAAAMQFLRAMRHDCIGRARAVTGMIESLGQESFFDPPLELREVVEQIDGRAKHLLRLLDDLFEAVASVVRDMTGETVTNSKIMNEQTRTKAG